MPSEFLLPFPFLPAFDGLLTWQHGVEISEAYST